MINGCSLIQNNGDEWCNPKFIALKEKNLSASILCPGKLSFKIGNQDKIIPK